MSGHSSVTEFSNMWFL